MTEEEDTPGIVNISGNPGEEGPTRRLLNAQMDLDDERTTARRWPLIMIFMLEGTLLLGTVARFSLTQLVDAFASADQKGDHKSMVTLCVVTTSWGQILLLPQLYMLGNLSKESLKVLLQLELAVLLLCLTPATQEGSCLHKALPWLLTFNIFILLAILMVRVLFHLRFRVVCPLLEFVVSRKCREFQALMLGIGVVGTALCQVYQALMLVIGLSGTALSLYQRADTTNWE